jgi:hypothetical protein
LTDSIHWYQIERLLCDDSATEFNRKKEDNVERGLEKSTTMNITK